MEEVRTSGAPAGRGETRTVVVMSYNIHHGVGTDRVLDLGRIADTIRLCRADIVGLQEVDRHFARRSRFVDQAATLAESLEMSCAFGANVEREPLEPTAPGRQYGNAILSRFPIEGFVNMDLPCRRGEERRGLLEATLDIDGQRLNAYSTHLQYNSRRSRTAQVAEIRTRVGGSAAPVVLLGDMNAGPRSTEISELTADLVDAWAAVGSGAGRTHPTRRPRVRIDYVLVSSDVGIDSAEVVTSSGSDHLPVAATLALATGEG